MAASTSDPTILQVLLFRLRAGSQAAGYVFVDLILADSMKFVISCIVFHINATLDLRSFDTCRYKWHKYMSKEVQRTLCNDSLLCIYCFQGVDYKFV